MIKKIELVQENYSISVNRLQNKGQEEREEHQKDFVFVYIARRRCMALGKTKLLK
jgi:hypothetical protein